MEDETVPGVVKADPVLNQNRRMPMYIYRCTVNSEPKEFSFFVEALVCEQRRSCCRAVTLMLMKGVD